MKYKNPVICVDFDGVIHSYKSGWKGVDVIPDDPVPGAIEWLERFLPAPGKGGLKHHTYLHIDQPDLQPKPIVCIYSARSKSWRGRRAMKKWLLKHGLSHWYITDGILKFPRKKPAAFLTIDDRAICFKGVFPTLEEMVGFKSWVKDDWDGTGIE